MKQIPIDPKTHRPASNKTGRPAHPRSGKLVKMLFDDEVEAAALAEEYRQSRMPPASTALSLSTAEARRAAVESYLQEVYDATGKRITRTDFWKAARYQSSTEFERWQRKDPRTTKTGYERFAAILKNKPHLK